MHCGIGAIGLLLQEFFFCFFVVYSKCSKLCHSIVNDGKTWRHEGLVGSLRTTEDLWASRTCRTFPLHGTL